MTCKGCTASVARQDCVAMLLRVCPPLHARRCEKLLCFPAYNVVSMLPCFRFVTCVAILTLHLMKRILGSSEKYSGTFSTEKIVKVIQNFPAAVYSWGTGSGFPWFWYFGLVTRDTILIISAVVLNCAVLNCAVLNCVILNCVVLNCGTELRGSGTFRRWTFRRRDYRAPELFFTLFRFVARFGRGKI